MGFVLRTIGFCSRFSKYFLLFRADGLILFGAGGGQNSPIRGQSGLFPKAGRGTNQKGAQEGPEGELKQEEPEQVMAGTEGRRNRKKSDAGGVGAGKAMWPGKGVERPGPEKGRCRGWRKSYAGGKGQRNAVSIQQAERNLRQGSSAPQGDAGSAI